MSDITEDKLSNEWKERLGLMGRRPPELYEASDSIVGVPHALAIRAILQDLNFSAVFCVQGVPTIVILSVEQYDRARIIDLHGLLWNQGLASLLLVISGDTLRVFSISRKPYKDSGEEFDQRCLINTLNVTADALQFWNIIHGAESGRLWREHPSFFQNKERIDQVLLDNLNESHRQLHEAGLSSDAAQALLLQAMFIAYLEDRKIITQGYFQSIAGDEVNSFLSLLIKGNVHDLSSLFRALWNDFNGDLFVAPCSFEGQEKAPKLNNIHLDVLARFREGQEVMGMGGQLRFWGYNFRYIPIELVSAVYDRFLAERKELKRKQGAYYTPMFLADTVVSQVWERLSAESKEKGQYLDPACGSGVFLVRLFQRLCEYWRSTHKSETIRWDILLTILQRIHGWDLNGGAVRVAVFSLYLALLEEVSPPDIQRLIRRKKILPQLWNNTLVCQDFFDVPENICHFQVIIGNPPWTSRRGSNRSSVSWCKKKSLPIPSGEDAWAFAWKAVHHLDSHGVVGFLLPAMGFLHNHSQNSIDARNRFIRENRIYRIINFADLRFQLFESAHRPTSLFVYSKRDEDYSYKFDYWAPKADLNLQLKRYITLSSTDKLTLNTVTAMDQPLCFKQRLWMREPDGKLFAYLSRFPKLGDLIKEFGSLSRRKTNLEGQWVIGQGYKPFKSQKDHTDSQYVGKLLDLPITMYERLAQPTLNLVPWLSATVHRKGFEQGYKGTRILVTRGISQSRLRASYTEESLTFQDIIMGITVPPGEKFRGKLLTAYLNSRIALWYAFHGTASFGSDRPEVKQGELLRLPFPSPEDLPDPGQAEDAAKKLVTLIDNSIQETKGESLFRNIDYQNVLRIIDQLTYQYFCLSEDEIILIEDAVENIIPATQPHEGSYPILWKMPSERQRQAYAETLAESISSWLDKETTISTRLEACSADLGILCLTLNGEPIPYKESSDNSFADVLSRISKHIRQPLFGNFHLIPDLRVFAGSNLYLIKPMQQRFWLRATALADADAIAMDLQDAIEFESLRS